MARGPRPTTPPPASSLPKVEFEIIKDSETTKRTGVNDAQARSYGFNDYSEEFTRPDHYIRYIEPLESDLARQVEYDMDEQDQEWLDAVNSDRKKEQLDKVSPEMFEVIMDRLEKEWFDLTKNIPKPDFALPSEDSTCAICDDSEGENSNAIVFCDGCNLAVHQDCYGVPYIPEGQWLCRKCTVSPETPVSCVLCPNEGGAFKQTDDGEWVHLLCAIWVPETRVANEVFMEPVTGVDRINKQRWKLRCTVCHTKEGACIQCTKSSCFAAFHATCARKEKLLLPMKATQGAEPVALTAYCEKHLPYEQAQVRQKALADLMDDSEEEEQEEENDSDPSRSPASTRRGRRLRQDQQQSKSLRAHAKTYQTGPPLVPAIILNRILAYIDKVKIRKKPEFVMMCCRYWSLKREARRGAPLLKRLHLEPWTAAKGGLVIGMDGEALAERRMRLDQLRLLRDDLERIRVLADGCRKRELKKLKRADVVQQLLAKALFPHEGKLRASFEKIMSHDKSNLFKHPVTKQEAPDYFDIVKKPMCWDDIDAKLDRHEYWDLQHFKDDVNLIFDNAFLYNKAGTLHHKAAARLQGQAKAIFEDLDKIAVVHRPPPPLLPKSKLEQDAPEAQQMDKTASPMAEVVESSSEPRDDAMQIDQPKKEASTPAPLEFNSELSAVQTGVFEHELETTEETEHVSSLANIIPPNRPQTPVQSGITQENEDLGNLEPPISVLQLLRSSETIVNDIDFLIPPDQGPISYLLDFTFGELKPPPPPREPTPPQAEEQVPVNKPKTKSQLAKERKKEQREKEKARRAALKAAKEAELDASPGFRAPRRSTRSDPSTVAGSEEPETGPSALQDHQHPPTASEPTASQQPSEHLDGEGVFSTPPPTTAGSGSSLPTSPATPRTPQSSQARSSAPPVVLPTTPAIVDTIDSKGMFRHFEAGFVLPEGSKRGGRVAYDEKKALEASRAATTTVEKVSKDKGKETERGEPPRKKARVVGGASKLSKFSTPASENETLAGQLPEPEMLSSEVPSSEVPSSDMPFSEVPPPPSSSTTSAAKPLTPIPAHFGTASTRSTTRYLAQLQASSPVASSEPPPATPASPSVPQTRQRGMLPSTIVHEADGTIVVEMLDTPDTRRLRNMEARKRQRGVMEEMRRVRLEQLKEGEDGDSGEGDREEGTEGGQDTKKGVTGDESELSELSESETGGGREVVVNQKEYQQRGEDGEGQQKDPGLATRSNKKGKLKAAPLVDPGSLVPVPDKKGNLPARTLVWAKFTGSPWWPGTIQDVSDPACPPKVKIAVEESIKGGGTKKGKKDDEGRLYCVSFFEEDSWAPIGLKQLRLFGVSEEFDEDMVSPSSRMQRFSKKNDRKKVRAAYVKAREAMGE